MFIRLNMFHVYCQIELICFAEHRANSHRMHAWASAAYIATMHDRCTAVKLRHVHVYQLFDETMPAELSSISTKKIDFIRFRIRQQKTHRQPELVFQH
jgi:hypothetical protein